MTIATPQPGSTGHPEAVLTALANDHRRAILRALEPLDGREMEFGALVDDVAERIRTEGSPDSTHRQRVRTGLHHVHLPKLDSCGLIVYDHEAKLVRSAADEPFQDLLTAVESYAVQS